MPVEMGSAETGGGSHVTIWHSRFALASETLSHFDAKVIAILSEHLLSIRLLHQQVCTPVYATWLATQARRRRWTLWARRPRQLPAWREPLAGRDTEVDRPPSK